MHQTLYTVTNTDSLRAMTEPALLTSRNQFDVLSLNEQVNVWVSFVHGVTQSTLLEQN